MALSAVEADDETAGYAVSLLALTLDGVEGRHGSGLALAKLES